MSSVSEQLRKSLEGQLPAIAKKHMEDVVRANRKFGEKVEVKEVNGKLTLSGDKEAVERITKTFK